MRNGHLCHVSWAQKGRRGLARGRGDRGLRLDASFDRAIRTYGITKYGCIYDIVLLALPYCGSYIVLCSRVVRFRVWGRIQVYAATLYM
eukprot:COSAG06_NODE_4412_length_4289_cov_1.720764_1_plen_89_part_00